MDPLVIAFLVATGVTILLAVVQWLRASRLEVTSERRWSDSLKQTSGSAEDAEQRLDDLSREITSSQARERDKQLDDATSIVLKEQLVTKLARQPPAGLARISSWTTMPPSVVAVLLDELVKDGAVEVVSSTQASQAQYRLTKRGEDDVLQRSSTSSSV